MASDAGTFLSLISWQCIDEVSGPSDNAIVQGHQCVKVISYAKLRQMQRGRQDQAFPSVTLWKEFLCGLTTRSSFPSIDKKVLVLWRGHFETTFKL